MEIREELTTRMGMGQPREHLGREIDERGSILTCTGHRDADETKLRPALEEALTIQLHNKGFCTARVGMAEGADIIFGEICLDFNIPFDAYIPDPGYYSHYIKGAWQTRFTKLLSSAVDVRYSSSNHDWRNNFQRNLDMIRDADTVFAAYRYPDIHRFTKQYRPRKGGTAHGIQVALQTGHMLGDSLIVIPDC